LTGSGQFFDDLETRSTDQREVDLFTGLAGQIANAKKNSVYFDNLLGYSSVGSVIDRATLAKISVTRKSDLQALQNKDPPFGGLVARQPGTLKRIFQSPGPIYEPEGFGEDWWRMARALYAAGIRRGDIVHNAFAYHLTPAGSMVETGAGKIGCAVVPAGVGNTEQQLAAIAAIGAVAYAGTPSFLKILLEKADEFGVNVSSLKKATVGGEALPPSLRQEIETHGVSCLQLYASADLGCIAYESSAREGLIIEEKLIVEIVRPGTNDPVAEGEVGEVVVTTLCPEYPLIRFGTGDLSAMLSGTSPCGRTNMRIKGWMGRADQTTKVKGMFVHPPQIAEVLKRHPEVSRARLIVDQKDGSDVMTLYCEVSDCGGERLEHGIAASLQTVCKLKGVVKFAAPESLANDGKVIDDIRTYE